MSGVALLIAPIPLLSLKFENSELLLRLQLTSKPIKLFLLKDRGANGALGTPSSMITPAEAERRVRRGHFVGHGSPTRVKMLVERAETVALPFQPCWRNTRSGVISYFPSLADAQ